MRRTIRVCASLFFSIAIFLWAGMSVPLVAKGPKSEVTVTSANPNTAVQGTVTLNVIVGGSGFDAVKGAKAQWFESGTTNPGGVTVNSTVVNSSSQITANITVSSTAYVGSYDIMVSNINGRSGKGTGLFSVTQSSNSPKTSCSGTGGATFNVTSYIYDNASPTFQLQNDGNSKYLAYKINKKDEAISEIQGVSCDWQLNLTSSKSRTVELSLLYPVPGQTPAPTLPPGWPTDGSPVNIPARVMTFCAQNPANGSTIDTATSVGNMTTANTSIQCDLHVGFTYGGISYSLRTNPRLYPGATWTQITCTDANSGQCDSWTVTPGVDPTTGQHATNVYTLQTSAIGDLVNHMTGASLGFYYVSFSGVITLP